MHFQCTTWHFIRKRLKFILTALQRFQFNKECQLCQFQAVRCTLIRSYIFFRFCSACFANHFNWILYGIEWVVNQKAIVNRLQTFFIYISHLFNSLFDVKKRLNSSARFRSFLTSTPIASAILNEQIFGCRKGSELSEKVCHHFFFQRLDHVSFSQCKEKG